MASSKTASLRELESTLEGYFVKKAPYQLPNEVKEVIVKFGPWVIVILMILTIPAVISALTVGTLFAPYGMMMAQRSIYFLFPAIVMAISVIFELMGLPGLFKRTIQGWRYLFYAELLSILSSLLSFNIVGAIVGFIIGFYILFQVKDMYK